MQQGSGAGRHTDRLAYRTFLDCRSVAKGVGCRHPAGQQVLAVQGVGWRHAASQQVLAVMSRESPYFRKIPRVVRVSARLRSAGETECEITSRT